MASALEGVRVVEVGEGKALAYAGKLLRDFGAEVIKVEPPHGDELRRYGPFPDGKPHPEQSGMFIYLNGGKRGLTRDLESKEGRAGLDPLLTEADVLLHSFRPSEARRLRLDEASLAATAPDLIVAAVTAFGSTGPYAEWKGHALHAYAGAGVAYRVGAPDREPLTSPLDGAEMHHGGVHTAIAVLLALHQRDRTGTAESVDVSVMEAVSVTIWGHGIPEVAYRGRPMVTRPGRSVSRSNLWGLAKTADGDFQFFTQMAPQWEAFLHEIGDPEWATSDPRMTRLGDTAFTRDLSQQERDEVQAILDAHFMPWARARTNAEIWEHTRRARIAFQPVMTVPQLCESDHFAARDCLVDAPGSHPSLRVPRSPFRMSMTPPAAPEPPPRLNDPPVTAWKSPRMERPRATETGAPFEGLRVLDLGQAWAGPLLARFLGDYGADVVSVRTTKRPWGSSVPGSTDPADPLAWEWIFRNRRSVAIDLKAPEGIDVFRRLAGVSDIVLDNLAPRALRSLGIDYAQLLEANPRLIAITLPGAGSDGPWADLTSYGPSLSALYGMLSLNGYPEDRAVMADVAELDPISAGYGMVAVLAALHARKRTGRGQVIELAQGEAAFAGIAEAVIEHYWNARDLGPVGNTHRVLAPHGMYSCRGDDAWIAIACADDEEWAALAHCIGHEEWLAQPEFATAEGRRAHRTALDAAISECTRSEEKYALAHRLQAADVAAIPVLTALEVIDDPHLMHRRAHMLRHEQFTGAQLLHGNAWHLSKSAPRLRRPAAAIGQHNVEVLGEYLEMAEDAVHRMEDAGVLV